MNTIIFVGFVFAIGVIFIFKLIGLIELIVKDEDYKREKGIVAVLFGIILVFVVLISSGDNL